MALGHHQRQAQAHPTKPHEQAHDIPAVPAPVAVAQGSNDAEHSGATHVPTSPAPGAVLGWEASNAARPVADTGHKTVAVRCVGALAAESSPQVASTA